MTTPATRAGTPNTIAGETLPSATDTAARKSSAWGQRWSSADCPTYMGRLADSSMVRPSTPERWFSTLLYPGSFTSKQHPLALGPEAVVAHATALGHDPVTRHHDRNRVRPTRGADGADRVGRADDLGDLAVGADLAVGDVPQGLPHAPLERGARDVERDVGGRGVTGDSLQHRVHNERERAVVALEVRTRELGAEVANEFGFGVAEQDEAQAARGRGDEQHTEIG